MVQNFPQFLIFSLSAFATAAFAAYLLLLRNSRSFTSWAVVFFGLFASSLAEFLKLLFETNHPGIWISQAVGYLLIAIGFVKIYRSVREREITRQQKQKIATIVADSKALIDPVTRLANRRQFETRAKVEFQHAVENHKSLSVLALRVDDFKEKFGAYGQDGADSILRSFAEVISSTIREAPRGEDLAARTNSDQFEILLVGADAGIARNVAGRLLEQIQLNPLNYRNQYVHLNASIGFYTYPWQSVDPSSNGSNSASVSQLIQAAEEALEKASRQGPGKIHQGPLMGSSKSEIHELDW